ncbi:putative bifunctional diguanylate cyclase/phosphodiesterase [Kineococcus sp. SYSU DK003]|uniref:putative bifunctional diguanylate cyclase/phosphodiesterase n=1 Tax=Kineococcus sp. SYSU DK003 TaxID=3383124 RepID=UPI003D7E5F4B
MSTEGRPAAVWTWLLSAAAVLLCVLSALVPGWRSPAVTVASVVSVLLVVAGSLWHRPRGPAWPLVGLMLALWATAGVLVQARGVLDDVTTPLVWAGQAVAVVVVLHVGRSGRQQAERTRASRLDLVVVVTVLGLVAAQLLATLASGRAAATAIVVATVDVALLGVLLRFTLTRRGLRASSWLLLVGALLTICYDLTSALHGRRLALPGEPAQSLGALAVLVIGLAAVHPSMTAAFTAETFARRRRPSGALLGMLPLVLVPAGTWWVAGAGGAAGLPGWTVPVAGAVVAGLCLLRASAALRSSEHLAEHDPLTDLANRRGLARAHEDRDPDQACALLLVDLDEFKQVNDTHGHDAGDALLLAVRDRLLGATGTSGVVARLGGDEFVVLTSAAGADAVAQRLLRSLEAPVVVDHLVLRVGASIGTALEQDGTSGTLAELLTHADVAMYAAKHAGGTRAVTFHPSMRVEVARRYTLSSEIRRLLDGRSPEVGQLVVHYQPLVDLGTGRAVGAEALVRWCHPARGLLAPADFLGLVADNDLDSLLDATVLDAVLGQVARWLDQGRPVLPVSVNLTPDSLAEPDLADRVLTALDRAGVPPRLLHLEITEHERLHENGPTTETLSLLDAAGVGIHLDDYGTGYTSLDYLHRFPVRLLKLDRSVVTTVTEQDAPLVAAVQAMAGALSLDVLAEGIESEPQREHLLRLGVRYGQGYLFSEPLPAEEYAGRYLPVPPAVGTTRLTAREPLPGA